MATTGNTNNNELSQSFRETFSAVNGSLNDLEDVLKPLFETPKNALYDQLEPLEQAKIDLTLVYGINSLFWMYLNVCGVNPKTHGIRGELDRIRTYMNRVKEIQDKQKAPVLDKPVAQRLVKSALWQAAQKKSDQPSQSNTKLSASPSREGALTESDIIPTKRQKRKKISK